MLSEGNRAAARTAGLLVGGALLLVVLAAGYSVISGGDGDVPDPASPSGVEALVVWPDGYTANQRRETTVVLADWVCTTSEQVGADRVFAAASGSEAGRDILDFFGHDPDRFGRFQAAAIDWKCADIS